MKDRENDKHIHIIKYLEVGKTKEQKKKDLVWPKSLFLQSNDCDEIERVDWFIMIIKLYSIIRCFNFMLLNLNENFIYLMN